MSIKRNPRQRTENDTRRIILDGHLTGAYEPLPGTRSPIITRERAVELRARARRANLIVTHREHPPRPEPTQTVIGSTGPAVLGVVDPERGCAIVWEPDVWMMSKAVSLADLRVVLAW